MNDQERTGSVRFKRELKVVLIPCLNEYRKALLHDDLW